MDAPDTPCRVCGRPSRYVFSNDVLGEHRVAYFDCERCGYLQTETPHWLAQAYATAINRSDTGILVRNQVNVGRVVMTLLACGRLHGTVVDHAGGYGILVRLLRDAGIEALWADKYCDNLVARGFEAGDTSCDLLTAFEVFEHLVDPLTELRSMLARAPFVLLSTDLVRSSAPPAPGWWYFATDHGQHIGFFRARTLAWMAGELGCHHRTDGRSVHIFGREPIPAAWTALLRRSRWWPIVARFRLKSKTRADLRGQAGPAVERSADTAQERDLEVPT